MAHTLYKIYYEEIGLVYIGRTNQLLQSRLRGHFFKYPMHREIDIDQVSLIEYAELPTEADMFLYEVYLINVHKPGLNRDDKACDELTVRLPALDFKAYRCELMNKWSVRLTEREIAEKEKRDNELRREMIKRDLRLLARRRKHDGDITEDEFYDELERIERL